MLRCVNVEAGESLEKWRLALSSLSVPDVGRPGCLDPSDLQPFFRARPRDLYQLRERTRSTRKEEISGLTEIGGHCTVCGKKVPFLC